MGKCFLVSVDICGQHGLFKHGRWSVPSNKASLPVGLGVQEASVEMRTMCMEGRTPEDI